MEETVHILRGRRHDMSQSLGVKDISQSLGVKEFAALLKRLTSESEPAIEG